MFIADRKLAKLIPAVDPLKVGWVYSKTVALQLDRINAICLKILRIRFHKSLNAKVLYLNFVANAILGYRASVGLSSQRTTRLLPGRILPGFILINDPWIIHEFS